MLKNDNKFKMPKEIGWLIPGLEVKRWFLIGLIGVIFITFGILLMFNMEPIIFILGLVKAFAKTVPTDIISGVSILIGFILFFKGWQKTNYSIFDIRDNRDKNAVLRRGSGRPDACPYQRSARHRERHRLYRV